MSKTRKFRNELIYEMRDTAKMTFRAIADELGISHVRVHEIYNLRKNKNDKTNKTTNK